MIPLPNKSNVTPAINRISRFYIVREIGRGATGVVYLARDPVIDRNVAIKTFGNGLSAVEKKQVEAQFINEARAAGCLNHPSIVTVYDACSEGDTPYIAMEYLEGAELSTLLDGGKTFMPFEVASIVRKIADALSCAHKQGVIHRDIKPANIFILANNQPKICDFGVARVPGRTSATSDTPDERGNEHPALFVDKLVGTPNYMSPEQALGRPVDELTDIYSLGAVMYEMLTLRKPFQADDAAAVLEALALKTPPAPHELNKAVPLGLSQITMKAMSKRPEKRYPSAEKMREDLNRYLTLEKHVWAKASALRAKREQSDGDDHTMPARPSQLLLGAGLAALALIATGVYLWLHH